MEYARAVLPRVEASALGHQVEDVEQRLARVAVGQHRRDASDEVGLAAEVLDSEAVVDQEVGLPLGHLALLGVDLDGHRLQQVLHVPRSGLGLGGHALEQDAFVGGVLVDEEETVGPLGRDVGLLYLAESPKGRGAPF